MKILHVVTKADVGGAQTYVLELATAQMAEGHSVTIAAGSLGPMATEARRRGVDVVEEASLRRELGGLSEWRASRRLGELIATCAPDVVHAHSSKAGLLARLAARRGRVPTVYTAHGWPFDAGARRTQRIVSWLGESFASRWWGEVICLTEADAALARRSHVVSARKLHVVHNGLPDVPRGQRADLAARTAGDLVTIVMVARFADQKAHAEALAALALMQPGGWHVQLVGDGPKLVETQQLCERLGLGDRVTFLGVRDDVPDLLAAADVALLWSHYEGMPLSLMEAMRSGLACIANDLPGVRVLFGDDGGAGVVVPFETAALAAALTRLVADDARRRTLGAAARARFVEQFSIEQNERGVMAAYRSAISACGRGTRAAG